MPSPCREAITVERTKAGYSGIDQLNQKTITKPGGASPFASWSNTYDMAGNRLTETATQPNDPISGLATFGYDTVQRLSSASQPTQTAGSFGYDAAHNLNGLGGSSFTYLANNALNQANAGAVNYAPDADGNQTKDNLSRVYRYDSLNRLQEVRDATGATVLVSYTYDGLGRLLTRTDATGTLQLVYRGLDDQVVKAINPSGTRSYAWDTNGRMLLEKLPDATLWTIATNPHGDIVGLDNATGTSPGAIHYDSWGQPLSQVDTTTSQLWAVLFGYQGGYSDSLTGQVRMGVRWYYPAVARFTSSDPGVAGADPTVPMAGHRWLYGRNNPLGYTDRSGRDAGCICFTDWSDSGGSGDGGGDGGGDPNPGGNDAGSPSPSAAPKAQQPVHSFNDWWQRLRKMGVGNYLLNLGKALDQAGKDLDVAKFEWDHAEQIADGDLANSWWAQLSGASSVLRLIADAKDPERIKRDPAQAAMDVVGVLPVVGVVGRGARIGGFLAKVIPEASRAGTVLERIGGLASGAAGRISSLATGFGGRVASLSSGLATRVGRAGQVAAEAAAPEAYEGVRALSRQLIDMGVSRAERVQIIQSFEVGTIKQVTAGSSDYGLRFFGGRSEAVSRYLSDTFPAAGDARAISALPPWNEMSDIAQFKIREGATYYAGRVAPAFGQPGGGIQYFVPYLKDLTRV